MMTYNLARIFDTFPQFTLMTSGVHKSNPPQSLPEYKADLFGSFSAEIWAIGHIWARPCDLQQFLTAISFAQKSRMLAWQAAN